MEQWETEKRPYGYWYFERILDENQKSFNATMDGFATVLSSTAGITNLTRRNLENLTGGAIYAYLDMTRFITPELIVEGRNPLHGVSMTVRDITAEERLAVRPGGPPSLDEIFSTQVRLNLGEMAPYHGQEIYPVPPLLRKLDERDLLVSFIAFNGYWDEKICLRRATNGTILAATTIVRRRREIVLRLVDQNYPQNKPCEELPVPTPTRPQVRQPAR